MILVGTMGAGTMGAGRIRVGMIGARMMVASEASGGDRRMAAGGPFGAREPCDRTIR